ncbi:MAG: hypothetical protein GX573_15105 [Chloroflexi bacterium]|nr:hypothetical protein [Chloroflexota bacterium]
MTFFSRLLRVLTKRETPLSNNSQTTTPKSTLRWVKRLVAIAQANPQGVTGKREEAEVKQIGQEINRKGGMRLMQAVHAAFIEYCIANGVSAGGWDRHIEGIWDGIGDWRG